MSVKKAPRKHNHVESDYAERNAHAMALSEFLRNEQKEGRRVVITRTHRQTGGVEKAILLNAHNSTHYIQLRGKRLEEGQGPEDYPFRATEHGNVSDVDEDYIAFLDDDVSIEGFAFSYPEWKRETLKHNVDMELKLYAETLAPAIDAKLNLKVGDIFAKGYGGPYTQLTYVMEVLDRVKPVPSGGGSDFCGFGPSGLWYNVVYAQGGNPNYLLASDEASITKRLGVKVGEDGRLYDDYLDIILNFQDALAAEADRQTTAGGVDGEVTIEFGIGSFTV